MAIFLEIKVFPAAGKQGCTPHTAPPTNALLSLKCFLKSVPEGGKANAELVKMLSKQLGVPQESITITSGATGRKKRVKIEAALSREEILEKLGIQ